MQHYLRMHLVVESNFDFACLFHGHGIGHRMGGRRQSQIGHMCTSLEVRTSSIARPCLSCHLWRMEPSQYFPDP